MCGLYHSVVTKWGVSNTTKLSVFKLVFILILTYGHESWVMTEKILSQVQAAEMGFCPWCDTLQQSAQLWKMQSRECQATSPESRDPSYVGSAMCPECPMKDW